MKVTMSNIFQSLGGAILVIAISVLAYEYGFLACGQEEAGVVIAWKAGCLPLYFGSAGQLVGEMIESVATALWYSPLWPNGPWLLATLGGSILAVASLPWHGGYLWVKMFSLVAWPLALLMASMMTESEAKVAGRFAATGCGMTFAVIFSVFH